MAAPFQLVMKHIWVKDLLPVFSDLADTGILAKNAQIGDEKVFIVMLYYAVSVGKISDQQAFEHVLLEQPEEVGRLFMTLREQYQAEGKQQGMQKSMILMARKLLEKGMSVSEVAGLTGLTLEAVKCLQAKRKIN